MRTPPVPLIALVSLLLGPVSCGARIRAAYDQARSEALADPGAVPDGWPADARLGISWDLVTTLAVRELSQRLEDPSNRLRIDLPLGAKAVIEPDVQLTGARVSPARACDTCARIASTFDGSLEWSVGSFGGEVPLSFELDAVLALESHPTATGHAVEANLRTVAIKLADIPQVDRLRVDLDDPLVAWLKEQVEQDFPAIPIAEVGSQEMPLRALRLGTTPAYLVVDVLTPSPVRSGQALPAPQRADWYLAMDQQVLLGLARKAAFEKGELDYGIYADPSSLALQERSFTLGLRLWRLAGSCWWRDYEVLGDLALDHGHLRLTPSSVHERDHSRGAALLDPLALLARGAILDAIEEALDVARPAEVREPIGGATLVLSVQEATGQGPALVLHGTADLTEKAKKKEKGKKSGGSGRTGGEGGAGRR
ncbi:MAG: hypothetical protein ABIO70_25130 [Pseudomonadota bacterium]